MSRTLNQEEIDAILGTAQKNTTVTKPERQVQTWDPISSGQLHNEQARAITTLHEAFARNLSHSLGAYLRIPFQVSLISVEQLTFEEFLGGFQAGSYVLALELTPPGVMAALQLDRSIVFPIVDVLLGGTGEAISISREISEIEEQIVEDVARIINRELATGWAPLGFEITLGERYSAPQIQRFLPQREKVLALSFEVKINDNSGTMNLVFPATVSHALLRKLTVDYEYRKPKANAGATARLRERLRSCPFDVLLGVQAITVRAGNMVGLSTGTILNLNVPEEAHASLIVGGRPVFQANAVRIGQYRAAQIVGPNHQKRQVRRKVQ